MHFRWNSTIIFTSSSSAPLAAHSSAVPLSHVSEGGFSCLHLHFPTLFCCKTEMILCQDSRWAAAAAKRKFQSQITSHTLVREIFNFSRNQTIHVVYLSQKGSITVFRNLKKSLIHFSPKLFTIIYHYYNTNYRR